MRIESVIQGPNNTRPDDLGYTTVLEVTSLFFDQPCATRLSLHLWNEVIDLTPGSIIRVDSRFVIRSDTDGTSDSIIRDDDGTLLFAYTEATRPEVFDEALYGLRLGKELDLLCQWPSGQATMRVHLEADGNECVLDAGAQRCCPLWGGAPYEVRAWGIYYPNGRPSTFMGFQIRKKGLVRSMATAPLPPICP